MEMVQVLKRYLPEEERVPKLDAGKRVQPRRRLPESLKSRKRFCEGLNEVEHIPLSEWVGIQRQKGGILSTMIYEVMTR